MPPFFNPEARTVRSPAVPSGAESHSQDSEVAQEVETSPVLEISDADKSVPIVPEHSEISPYEGALSDFRAREITLSKEIVGHLDRLKANDFKYSIERSTIWDDGLGTRLYGDIEVLSGIIHSNLESAADLPFSLVRVRKSGSETTLHTALVWRECSFVSGDRSVDWINRIVEPQFEMFDRRRSNLNSAISSPDFDEITSIADWSFDFSVEYAPPNPNLGERKECDNLTICFHGAAELAGQEVIIQIRGKFARRDGYLYSGESGHSFDTYDGSIHPADDSDTNLLKEIKTDSKQFKRIFDALTRKREICERGGERTFEERLIGLARYGRTVEMFYLAMSTLNEIGTGQDKFREMLEMVRKNRTVSIPLTPGVVSITVAAAGAISGFAVLLGAHFIPVFLAHPITCGIVGTLALIPLVRAIERVAGNRPGRYYEMRDDLLLRRIAEPRLSVPVFREEVAAISADRRLDAKTRITAAKLLEDLDPQQSVELGLQLLKSWIPRRAMKGLDLLVGAPRELAEEAVLKIHKRSFSPALRERAFTVLQSLSFTPAQKTGLI